MGRYRYDALGRRTAVRLDGSLVRRFVYGGAEFPRARVDADGDVIERYVYASYGHVPDLIVRRDGQRLRLISDSLGSVRAVVDADTGAVVQRLAYDAYGQVTQDTAPGTQPFGFKGAISDPVAQGAGLVWMGVRAYLPSLARFTTPDPAGLKAAWNQHDALGGDPVNLIDADGRFFALALAPAAVLAAGAYAIWASQHPDEAQAAGAGIANAISSLTGVCEDALGDAINWGEDVLGGDDDGDGYDDRAGEVQSPSDEKKVARDLGVTKQQVNDAIHDLKDELTRGGGSRNNPDVWVDPDSGETYPVGPGNVLGDSLGNIRDVLGLQ